MADPEFQSMLKDYMEEMQDPAVRAVRTPPLHMGLREGKGREWRPSREIFDSNLIR